VRSRRPAAGPVEQELLAREEFTRGILNGVTEGVITTDERGLVESYNPAAEQMFGYAPHEITGGGLTLLIVNADADQHDRRLRGDLGAREVVGRRNDGSIFPMELTEAK
jgi:PAS domain S-box-containing protein